MTTKELIEMLRQNKNPGKIEAMENYMRNQFKFLGLQAAERRKLARPFLNEKVQETRAKARDTQNSVTDWELLFTLWDQPEREFQLIGIDYLKKIQDDLVSADLVNLRQLVLTKSWWDTVDFLSKHIGAIVQKEPHLREEMVKWSVDENLWIRRVAILHQLSLKEGTDIKLLREIILNTIDEEEFFIQKAIGWALREYAKTDKDWVRRFVEEFREEWSPLSYREATKHFNEGNNLKKE